MLSDARVWLALSCAMPIVVVLMTLAPLDVQRLRRIAVGAAVGMLSTSIAAARLPHAVYIRTSALTWAPGGEALVRVDALSSVLLPLAAGLWLLTVAVT